ncbi:hypothetical protein BK816_08875 [Boudabousia tangfeifanii]|uniref:Gram-positive cocci surface proteins LPxTG domain-containing protein n=1 Tax=Boudabousia tangfeifanii TaxID=1912795 RepID=A0A1D9MMJ7_9ACTO|nr:SpaH/EbpB family LPXTG-anchored major pilin [Boudabousia tangfeifanii]AOZ73370.1 hypothetical protein BK816_08875 [Boudabousia tangfeifanii]
MTRTFTRATASLSVAAVAVLGLGSSMAFAATPEGAATPESTVVTTKDVTANVGAMDKDAAVSLTIHKFTPGSKKAEANGKELADTTEALGSEAKPVEGVQFDAYTVEYDGAALDLTTNAGWKLATEFKKLYDGDKSATTWEFEGKNFTLSAAAAATGKTAADGSLKMTTLSKSLYVVKETVPAGNAGVKVGGEELKASEALNPAQDGFVVALPLTDPTTKNAWMYDVHVYPKNSKAGIKKEIVDTTAPGSGNAAAKSEVTYKVTTDIPNVEKLAEYQVIDGLNEKLTYTGEGKDVLKVVDGETFAAGTDYNIVSTKSTLDQKTYVTVTFTDAGLRKLEANKGKKVEWTLNAHVEDTTAAQEIPNDAHLVQTPGDTPSNSWNPETSPNKPGDDPKKPNIPGIPSNEVKTYYGKAKIVKVDKTNTETKLAGAVFKLYQCNAEGKFVKPDGSLADTDAEAEVSVDGVSEWTSAEKTGLVEIDGLLVNDFRNNSENDAAGTPWKTNWFYCLKETKAPAGYELLPNPVRFQVLKTNANFTSEFNVENVPTNAGFKLPVTGGAGITALVAAGTLLLAGSGAYVLAANRKRKQA